LLTFSENEDKLGAKKAENDSVKNARKTIEDNVKSLAEKLDQSNFEEAMKECDDIKTKTAEQDSEVAANNAQKDSVMVKLGENNLEKNVNDTKDSELQNIIKEKTFNVKILQQRLIDEMKIVEQVCESKITFKGQNMKEQNFEIFEQIKTSTDKTTKVEAELTELEMKCQDLNNAKLEADLAEKLQYRDSANSKQLEQNLKLQKLADDKKQILVEITAAHDEMKKAKSNMEGDIKHMNTKLNRLENKFIFHGVNEAEDENDAMSELSSSISGLKPMTIKPSSSDNSSGETPEPERKKRAA
jgi:hypothetical protein